MNRILLQKSWRQAARRDASAMSDCRKDFVRLRLAYGLPGNGLRKTRSRRQGRRFRGRFFRIRERSIVRIAVVAALALSGGTRRSSWTANAKLQRAK